MYCFGLAGRGRRPGLKRMKAAFPGRLPLDRSRHLSENTSPDRTPLPARKTANTILSPYVFHYCLAVIPANAGIQVFQWPPAFAGRDSTPWKRGKTIQLQERNSVYRASSFKHRASGIEYPARPEEENS